MSDITYSIYNKNSFAIIGSREKYDTQFKAIGGRWYNNLKPSGAGWLVARSKEDLIKKIISDDIQPAQSQPAPSQPAPPVVAKKTPPNTFERLTEMKQHARPRQTQDRYHRSTSASRQARPIPSQPSPLNLDKSPSPVSKYTKYRHTPQHSRTSNTSDDRLRPRRSEHPPSRERGYSRRYSPDYRERRGEYRERRHSPTRDHHDRSPYGDRSILEEMRYLTERMNKLQNKFK